MYHNRVWLFQDYSGSRDIGVYCGWVAALFSAKHFLKVSPGMVLLFWRERQIKASLMLRKKAWDWSLSGNDPDKARWTQVRWFLVVATSQ